MLHVSLLNITLRYSTPKRPRELIDQSSGQMNLFILLSITTQRQKIHKYSSIEHMIILGTVSTLHVSRFQLDSRI